MAIDVVMPQMGAYGTGVSSEVTRSIGPSRSSKASSQTIAAISPAMPPVRVSSCTTSSLFVFFHGRKNRFLVQRQQRAQVDHFRVDAFLASSRPLPSTCAPWPRN